MPSWRDLKRFLDHSKRAVFDKTGDHYYYRWYYEDGSYKTVRCSFGSKEIGPRLWKDILKKELRITQEEFNAEI